MECTGIGAEICVRNLRQEIGTEVCREGVEPVELHGGAEKGKGKNRYKKRPRKNRGHTVELNFRAEVSTATHIGWTKRSLFFHRCWARNFAYRVVGFAERSVRQTPDSSFVLGSIRASRLRFLFRSQAAVPGFLSGFQPPWIRSALRLLFRSQAAAPVSSPGSDLLIRSAPGPGIIRRAAPARTRRHRLPESRPAAWRRALRTRSRAPAASRRPS